MAVTIATVTQLAQNMVVFVHPPGQHISTQKMNGEFQDFHSQLKLLDFLRELLLYVPNFLIWWHMCSVFILNESRSWICHTVMHAQLIWFYTWCWPKACGLWQWDNETPQFINLIEAKFSYLSQVPSSQIHLVVLISPPSYQQYSFGLLSRCQMRGVLKLPMQWGNWNLLLSCLFSDDLVSQELWLKKSFNRLHACWAFGEVPPDCSSSSPFLKKSFINTPFYKEKIIKDSHVWNKYLENCADFEHSKAMMKLWSRGRKNPSPSSWVVIVTEKHSLTTKSELKSEEETFDSFTTRIVETLL